MAKEAYLVSGIECRTLLQANFIITSDLTETCVPLVEHLWECVCVTVTLNAEFFYVWGREGVGVERVF